MVEALNPIHHPMTIALFRGSPSRVINLMVLCSTDVFRSVPLNVLSLSLTPVMILQIPQAAKTFTKQTKSTKKEKIVFLVSERSIVLDSSTPGS